MAERRVSVPWRGLLVVWAGRAGRPSRCGCVCGRRCRAVGPRPSAEVVRSGQKVSLRHLSCWGVQGSLRGSRDVAATGRGHRSADGLHAVRTCRPGPWPAAATSAIPKPARSVVHWGHATTRSFPCRRSRSRSPAGPWSPASSPPSRPAAGSLIRLVPTRVNGYPALAAYPHRAGIERATASFRQSTRSRPRPSRRPARPASGGSVAAPGRSPTRSPTQPMWE